MIHLKVLPILVLVLLASGSVCAASRQSERQLCQLFLDEFSESVRDQLQISLEANFCRNLGQNQLSFSSTVLKETGIEKVLMALNISDKMINCEIDKVVVDNSPFTRAPSYEQGKQFYFPAGGKGCTVRDSQAGTSKTFQLIKKFTKYDGKPLKDIIGTDQNLTFHYPNNMDVKVSYPNGGSLYTPFAFKGIGTTIYATAEKKFIQELLNLTGMAPVTVRENGYERALVALVIYNFHDSGVGPYSEFQVAPLIQPDIPEQLISPFSSIEDFINGLDNSPGMGLAKSFHGKISLWQNYLFISSYNTAFAELAIKGGRGVSYPKFLAQQQQLSVGGQLTTWISQPKTAVSGEFDFKLTAIFPKNIESLSFELLEDQALVHSMFNSTTKKWNTVIVQSNSRDSTLFATQFKPRGILRFSGQSDIAVRLSKMRLRPLVAQISKDIRGATWTTKRDGGALFYEEASFMNPIPSP